MEEWNATHRPLRPRHFEVTGNFMEVYDDENDFIVHTLRLDELFPMVENPYGIGGILQVTTKLCEKIVIANGLTNSQMKFMREIAEESIGDAHA